MPDAECSMPDAKSRRSWFFWFGIRRRSFSVGHSALTRLLTAMTAPPQHDFNHAILQETAHRPWPMPQSAWMMTQTWHDLLLAHWPVSVDALRERVPASFPIDRFENQAWLGVVPFYMTNVAPRFVPALPWVSSFPEMNVRTYVTVDGKPGVYFFSLDAGNPVAVGAARTLLHLPYFTASMKVETRDGYVHYTSHRASSEGRAVEFVGRYRPTGPVAPPQPGTLEHFLTERYCLYAVDHANHPYRLEIHHPPWPLQSAEAEISKNTMAEAAGLRLPSMAPLLHFSKRQDMIAWPPERI
jgi:uncharacterized protein YqjF (DUF2071 family)